MSNTDLKRTAPPPLLPQGRRQVYKGGGLDPRYDKRGEGGVGGCVRVCVCCTLQAQYERRGGCLAEEGEVPYMKGIARALQLIINDFRNFNNSSAKIFLSGQTLKHPLR